MALYCHGPGSPPWLEAVVWVEVGVGGGWLEGISHGYELRGNVVRWQVYEWHVEW